MEREHTREAELFGLLDEYLDHCRDHDMARATLNAVRHKVRAFFDWHATEGVRLSQQSLIAYRDHRQLSGRRPRTIRADITVIGMYFRWLKVEKGFRNLPDPDFVKRPAMDRARRYVVTDAEVAALTSAADRIAAGQSYRGRKAYARFVECRAKAVLAVLLNTGVRRSELLAADLCDLLPDGRKGEPPRLRVRKSKMGQYREIPLNRPVQVALNNWMEARAAYLVQAGGPHSPDVDQALFLADAYARLGNSGLDLLFVRLRALADLMDSAITPHCLRGWFITRTAAAVDIPTAALLAGHQSVQTTAEHYLRSDAARADAAVKALDGEALPQPPAPLRPVTEAAEPGPSRRQPAARQRDFFRLRRQTPPGYSAPR